MTDYRIIDISDDPARVSVKYEQLVIKRDGQEAAAPLSEIAAVVVSNPQVTYTHNALSGLAEAGAALVVCDSKHLPAGMMLPLVGHFVQSERFSRQSNASAPTRKQIWKQIVKAKVEAQGKLLKELHGKDQGLIALSRRVKSGDSENIEAQASRRYWPALFGDKKFRRDRTREDQNRHLNYGYAVLRAIVARAICGAGLHPSLGVHHHNRYDAFCLADDLMEPYRPLVDKAVANWTKDNDPKTELDKHAKQALLGPLTRKYPVDGEERSLFDAASRMAGSLAKTFEGKTKDLVIPEV